MEERLKRAKVYDAGLIWDVRRKCAREEKKPPKRRVPKGAHSIQQQSKKRKSRNKSISKTTTAATSTPSSADTTADPNPTTEYSRHGHEHSSMNSDPKTVPAYGINYMIPGYSLPPVSMSSNSTDFGHFSNM